MAGSELGRLLRVFTRGLDRSEEVQAVLERARGGEPLTLYLVECAVGTMADPGQLYAGREEARLADPDRARRATELADQLATGWAAGVPTTVATAAHQALGSRLLATTPAPLERRRQLAAPWEAAVAARDRLATIGPAAERAAATLLGWGWWAPLDSLLRQLATPARAALVLLRFRQKDTPMPWKATVLLGAILALVEQGLERPLPPYSSHLVQAAVERYVPDCLDALDDARRAGAQLIGETGRTVDQELIWQLTAIVGGLREAVHLIDDDAQAERRMARQTAFLQEKFGRHVVD